MIDWVDIAQIVTAIMTLIGVVTSIWLSVKALREVQRDRKLNHKPYLIFDFGAHRLAIEFAKKGKAIPGINPAYVKEAFAHLSDNIESVRVKKRQRDGKSEIVHYGYLKNYGNGPAIDVDVVFNPKLVWIGSEKFKLNEDKLKEPQYERGLNKLPISPTHIPKGQGGQLSRIPTFIEKDFEKKITRVEGTLEIEYKDIFLDKHMTKQAFRLFTNYEGDDKYVQVVFSDIEIE